jgi:hypothetical protein
MKNNNTKNAPRDGDLTTAPATPTNALQLLLPLQSRRKHRRKVIANDDSRARRRAEKTAPSCPL